MKAAIAGNYSIDPGMVATHLLRELASLPIDAEVLLRLPLSGSPGPLESLAEALCDQLSIPSHWRLPEPGSGREGTLERDFRMVDEADLLLAYFDGEHVMDPARGTTRLVEHALRTGTPVHAYAPKDEGEPVLVGSAEGGDA